jgi:ferredoxin hydrogenase small subunit
VAGGAASLAGLDIIKKWSRHMENRTYDYIENPVRLTRRQFITISGIVIALLALPVVWIASLASRKNDYILARTKGLYLDDTKSKIRVSHANRSVEKYYKDFGDKPLGEKSEELLHTKYIDRTKVPV